MFGTFVCLLERGLCVASGRCVGGLAFLVNDLSHEAIVIYRANLAGTLAENSRNDCGKTDGSWGKGNGYRTEFAREKWSRWLGRGRGGVGGGVGGSVRREESPAAPGLYEAVLNQVRDSYDVLNWLLKSVAVDIPRDWWRTSEVAPVVANR